MTENFPKIDRSLQPSVRFDHLYEFDVNSKIDSEVMRSTLSGSSKLHSPQSWHFSKNSNKTSSKVSSSGNIRNKSWKTACKFCFGTLPPDSTIKNSMTFRSNNFFAKIIDLAKKNGVNFSANIVKGVECEYQYLIGVSLTNQYPNHRTALS
uniref:Uncharacterized protein n=1 Tax=Romanomermis culicivorax TaxID=13658 RepID=A0A915I3Q1_ROMCU